MFESIKDALQKPETQSRVRDILKFEVSKTYLLRILPNIKEPSKTFFHYYNHAWESFSTGQFLSEVSPSTWGERDPISEARFAILKHGDEEEKEKARCLTRRESWLANVYVIDDPTNPENNGSVKIMRFGRQLHKIIMDAIEGEDAETFGPRIFDLTDSGVTFKVKVERQGEFPTYVSSKFGPATSAVPGLDDSNMKEVYDGVFDLDSTFSVKSYDELKNILNEHFYGKNPDDEGTADGDKEDDVPYDTPVASPAPEKKKEKQPAAKEEDDDPLNDDKVRELLEGLNS